jgi:dienelactone hydrolase
MGKRAFIRGAIAFMVLAGRAAAEVKTEEIEYRQGETVLQGFLAYDDAAKGKRPGVLVVHEWWGHNDHARNQARKLAEAGYVGFALDMYGKGKVATHPEEAKAFMSELMKNSELLTARFEAGLDVLKKQAKVDPEHIAVFGYCFGGGVALNRARAGADVDAVAAFHPGGLKPAAAPAAKGKVKPRILVQVGDADPYVPKEQVDAFQKEMKAAGVKAKVITYPGVKHAFTNPDADKTGIDALAYNAEADARSWKEATKLLREVFGKK